MHARTLFEYFWTVEQKHPPMHYRAWKDHFELDLSERRKSYTPWMVYFLDIISTIHGIQLLMLCQLFKIFVKIIYCYVFIYC